MAKKGSRERRKQEITRLVIHAKAMRLNTAEALVYLRTRGHAIADRTYFKYKEKIDSSTWDRAEEIAKGGLLEQHMRRIDNLETIEHEQWLSLNMSKNPNARSQILERIAVLQPYITAMYDYTRAIMEKQTELKKVYVIGKRSVGTESISSS